VAPVITDMTKLFMFHILWISILRFLYFSFFSDSFCLLLLLLLLLFGYICLLSLSASPPLREWTPGASDTQGLSPFSEPLPEIAVP
jgi:hypothetical protein